jgi:hypothetical protein
VTLLGQLNGIADSQVLQMKFAPADLDFLAPKSQVLNRKLTVECSSSEYTHKYKGVSPVCLNGLDCNAESHTASHPRNTLALFRRSLVPKIP